MQTFSGKPLISGQTITYPLKDAKARERFDEDRFIRRFIIRHHKKEMYTCISPEEITKKAFAIYADFRINDIARINKLFEKLNQKLPINGEILIRVQSLKQREEEILKKWNFFAPLALSLDFWVHRVLPKLDFSKSLYFKLSRGHNRAISHSETLGRLYSCGFSFLEEKTVGQQTYIVARKTGEPSYDPAPTYGPFIRLKRVGKEGKIIQVLKFRTMHPFSEYLQQYIYEQNNLQKGGKFMNDFRITKLGHFMRKCWLDELPSIINLFRGELKIIGVRPLSRHYYNLYHDELKQERIKYKPGLIPPFYADMPNTIEEIMESEMRYLKSYGQAPLSTDIRYFTKAMFNIVIKRARSN